LYLAVFISGTKAQLSITLFVHCVLLPPKREGVSAPESPCGVGVVVKENSLLPEVIKEGFSTAFDHSEFENPPRYCYSQKL
jgi:hypothetical protein